jgi:hypothetical protein
LRTLKTIKFNDVEDDPDCLNTDEREDEREDQMETLSLNDMCSFFLKTNISDFNKTYYNALNKFKLREEYTFSLFLSNLSKIRKVF